MGNQALLTELNQSYVRAYAEGNSDFFSQVLADDFRETAPDGTILNREEFLLKIAAKAHKSPTMIKIRAAEVEVRIFGDTAVVHARSIITTPDGSTIIGGRYTDIYSRIEEKWLCVAAHLGGVP